MDPRAVLLAYDEQVRRRPGGLVERDDAVVRCVGEWHGVTWSALEDTDADAVIAAQIERFAGVADRWEWKHHSYDRPADLPERLVAAGFERGVEEALLVAELATLQLDVAPPVGVQLREIVDAAGVEALVSVHDEVFGGDHSALDRLLLDAPDRVVGVLAVAGDVPVAGARVEFHPGSEFASLWGGGTVASWRGRGVFRSLVAWRAALAAARGFRYLQVDALPASRPILTRLGFVQLATTTPFEYVN